MSSLAQDLKYAIRMLLRSPGYTAAALVSLGLGIGANAAIFTLTNAVFLHSLPVEEPSRVIELYTVDHATHTSVANLTRTPISYPNIQDLREQNDVFTGLAAFTQTGLTLTGFTKPAQQPAFVVSANYFDVLGVKAFRGRMFRPDEDRTPGGNNVTVLSFTLAQKLFGSPEAALHRPVSLNSISYEVIGVAPPNFKGTLSVGPPDVLWIPLSMHSQVFSGPVEQFFNDRRFRVLSAFGRLRPGIDERRALSSLQTIAARLEAAYPRDNRGRTVETEPLSQAKLGFIPRGQTTAAAFALSAAVGFVLLIACANIANLSLARATRRGREMGIRVALGAPRGALVKQLLIEAELLALAGGLLGIGIGWFGAKLLWNFRPAFLNASDINLQPDLRVYTFTIGISLITGLLFGLAPVFRASVPDLTKLLNSAGRSNIEGGGHSRTRSVLVICEIALAVVALAGAGLFIRSMQHAQRIRLGFETEHLAIFSFNLASQHMSPERGRQFVRSALEKVAAIPGVASAAVAANPPVSGGFLQTVFREGDPVDSRLGTLVLTMGVSPSYFATMRIPLRQGRLINGFDRQGTKAVAVVTQALAQRIWPGQNAVGKRFHLPSGTEFFEIVGVVDNTTVFNIGEPPQPVAYFPFEQNFQPFEVIHIRTAGPPALVLPSAMAAVQSLDPDLALLNPTTIREVLARALWAPRIAATLFGLFGLLSVGLAIVGIYGVMAYMVVQRTSELGVRIALGASNLDVMGMVVGQSMRLALTGIVIGGCVALALTRFVANLLFNVSPADPITFTAVALLLAATAFLASSVPAWRASRLDPAVALRVE